MPNIRQQDRFQKEQGGQSRGNGQMSPGLDPARPRRLGAGEMVLDGGDDEVGLKTSDASQRRLAEQELPAGPGELAPEEARGHQVRKIARCCRAMAQDRRSGPIDAPRLWRLLRRQARQ